MSKGRGTTLPWVISLTVALIMAGCEMRREGPGRRPAVDETPVEVGGPIDDSLSTAEDLKAASAGDQVTAVLPRDFPPGLPVYAPANMTAFGVGAGGMSYVILESPDPESFVRARYSTELAAAGWQATGGDTYVRAGMQVRIQVREVLPITEIHIEYRSPNSS